MPRSKKGKSKKIGASKEGQKKLVKVIDERKDRTAVVAMEEAAFLHLVQKENLFCFNFESFSAVTLRGEDPGEDTWCPSADAEPGRLFTHKIVYIDFSSKFPNAVAVLRERKLEKDRRSMLQQELIEAEMVQKAKSLHINSPSSQITYTDLDTQTTNTVSTKVFQKAARKHKWFVFNEAACHILYEMPSGGGSVENPRYWHYELEWEKFHMEGHVYVEVRRAIHDVLEEAEKKVETGESSQQAQVDMQPLMQAEAIVEDMQALAAIKDG